MLPLHSKKKIKEQNFLKCVQLLGHQLLLLLCQCIPLVVRLLDNRFYGQAPPAIMPPQPGFGYQQQLLPGMSPGGPPMPNFFVPMVQQGQQGQRPGGGHGGPVPVQQGQQPLPFVQQQGIYCALSHYLRDAGVSQPISIGAFSSALANASPSDQRTMLGENLYPLVEQLEPEYAAKITGMLLEMDKTEVLHLLESPEALRAEVAEAMEVLRNVQQQQVTNPAHQLAALPFYDGILKKECKTS
ncbi:hypothetical protein Vadar_027475 [Vaccinium darrowii]|uniref:Uncharacterized protein n=1 Tax=Vaccinium darrowii TaxID=229202 RepID=A0ACB7X4L0_9ERIC|nr:hypothetical protein Vadar_027475 [Vaccinium darrowii]